MRQARREKKNIVNNQTREQKRKNTIKNRFILLARLFRS